jgi:hypothetical protein
VIDKTTMSLFEVLYLLVTTGGFVAVSIQLWIQRHQTRLLLKTLEANTSTSVAQRQLEVDSLFVEEPHLVEYFLEGKIPSENHLREASATAMLLLNYFETYFLQKQQTSQMYSEEAWECYIALHFKNSPFLCQFLERHAGLYSKELCEFMGKAALDSSRAVATEIKGYTQPQVEQKPETHVSITG